MFLLLTLRNQYMVHGFDSIRIAKFPAMICSVSAEGFLNHVTHSIQMFLLLTLSKSFLLNLCAFNACLPLRHTWSDFSCLLRVMISETRILCHFILVLLSSTLMKQLTCNVGIISLIRIFGLDI